MKKNTSEVRKYFRSIGLKDKDKTLEQKLIEHYDCFNRERFFVDEHNEKDGFLSIVSSSINDPCPINLCRGIARFCKKNIDWKRYKFIYIGPWVFKTEKL